MKGRTTRHVLRPARLALALLVAAALAPEAPAQAAEEPAARAVLFRNVAVVTMREEGVLAGRDVLVRDGRIVRIGAGAAIAPPRGARIIEGSGRWLMPGLAEMHAHLPVPEQAQYAEDVLFLFAAHGVTTIRGMLGHPWHLELRERLRRGELVGPRLYTAGPSFNDRSTPDAASAEEARARAARGRL